MTGCWTHNLYRVKRNIYGLSNAPHLWACEVSQCLIALGYCKHHFDPALFLKFAPDGVGCETLVSIILVYVDDFAGCSRADYPISEAHSAFKWGDFKLIEVDKTYTFKGKQLQFFQQPSGKLKLKISMDSFIENLGSSATAKGRLSKQPELTPPKQQECRSVTGCLQWVATQARPEIAPTVSLCNHGSNTTTISDLKCLYEAIDFLKQTPLHAIVLPGVPIELGTMSWHTLTRAGQMRGEALLNWV